LAAAPSLGAESVSMGTRFMLTKECVLHDNFKKLRPAATEQDTPPVPAGNELVDRITAEAKRRSRYRETGWRNRKIDASLSKTGSLRSAWFVLPLLTDGSGGNSGLSVPFVPDYLERQKTQRVKT